MHSQCRIVRGDTIAPNHYAIPQQNEKNHKAICPYKVVLFVHGRSEDNETILA